MTTYLTFTGWKEDLLVELSRLATVARRTGDWTALARRVKSCVDPPVSALRKARLEKLREYAAPPNVLAAMEFMTRPRPALLRELAGKDEPVHLLPACFELLARDEELDVFCEGSDWDDDRFDPLEGVYWLVDPAHRVVKPRREGTQYLTSARARVEAHTIAETEPGYLDRPALDCPLTRERAMVFGRVPYPLAAFLADDAPPRDPDDDSEGLPRFDPFMDLNWTPASATSEVAGFLRRSLEQAPPPPEAYAAAAGLRGWPEDYATFLAEVRAFGETLASFHDRSALRGTSVEFTSGVS